MTSASFEWVSRHIKQTKPAPHFYELHRNRAATFSTKGGTIPKRQNPYPLPPPLARSNVDADIRRKATSLRMEFPEIVRKIDKPPASWYELHNYFDAVDLWNEGAAFLFYVMNHIANENILLNHDLEQTKLAEIRSWAKLWVEGNIKRILSIPPTQDLISAFDGSELESIQGLEQHQLGQLRRALDDYRMEHEHLRARFDVDKFQARTPAIHHMQQMYHSDASSYPDLQQHIRNGFPLTPPVVPMIPQEPLGSGRVYPIAMEESRCNQLMMIQPMPPMQQIVPQSMQHVPVEKLMGGRGQESTIRQDANSQWERSLHGWSNETGRTIHGRGLNNFTHQMRSHHHTNDRRIAADCSTSRRSPLRRVSQNDTFHDPIYIHDPQRQPPSFDGNATPRAGGRGVNEYNQKKVPDSLHHRVGNSNDARHWRGSRSILSANRQRADQNPQEMTDTGVVLPPFANHPQAFINSITGSPSCTFWYHGDPRHVAYDDQQSRTVYARGVQRIDFETHELKDLFAQFGEVESINFLYAAVYPSAFIAFMEGYERSVQASIDGLNDHTMPSGEKILVGLPNTRSRSNSQASNYSAYAPRGRSNSTIPRDLNYHGNSRRGSVRHNSLSYRMPNLFGEHCRAPSHPSEGFNPTQIPLRQEFQASLHPAQHFPVHQVAERLSSTMAEVFQHQVAINRYSIQNQTALGNFENRIPNRNCSNIDTEQPYKVMSEESHKHKENRPIKKDPGKQASSASPKKVSPQSQVGDHQKGYGGKNKKKARKETWSNRQSRASSPAKNNIQNMVIDVLASVGKAQQADSSSGALEAPSSVSNSLQLDHLNVDAPINDITKAYASKIDSPKPSSKITSSASVKNSEAEGSILPQIMADDHASLILEKKNVKMDRMERNPISVTISMGGRDTLNTNGLGLDGVAMLAESASPVLNVSGLLAKPMVELPFLSFPNPGVGDVENHSSTAADSSYIDTIMSPPLISKSHGEVIPEVGVKPKKKAKKKQRNASPSNIDLDQSTMSVNSKDSSETLKSSTMTEYSEQFVTALSSPNPSRASGPSAYLATAETTNINFETTATVSCPFEKKHLVATKHSKTNSDASACSTPKSAVKGGKKNLQSHSRTDSNSSNTSSSSAHKVPKNPKRSSEKIFRKLKSGDGELQRSQKDNNPNSAAVYLSDFMQWPTLEPVKTPWALVDGRVPNVPSLHSLSKRKKLSNAPIIPAVPLNMQQRRRPSINSRTWPIIKKCDMK